MHSDFDKQLKLSCSVFLSLKWGNKAILPNRGVVRTKYNKPLRALKCRGSTFPVKVQNKTNVGCWKIPYYKY